MFKVLEGLRKANFVVQRVISHDSSNSKKKEYINETHYLERQREFAPHETIDLFNKCFMDFSGY